jgi:putative transposase
MVPNDPSAESAIHFQRHFDHRWRHASIVKQVIIHIIFSTKNREPRFDSDVRPRMHAYLATVCRDLDAEIAHVGGVTDHVHVVTTLPRTLSQAKFIEKVKKASSKWIKTVDVRYRGFFWQRGYGMFSVSPS